MIKEWERDIEGLWKGIRQWIILKGIEEGERVMGSLEGEEEEGGGFAPSLAHQLPITAGT